MILAKNILVAGNDRILIQGAGQGKTLVAEARMVFAAELRLRIPLRMQRIVGIFGWEKVTSWANTSFSPSWRRH